MKWRYFILTVFIAAGWSGVGYAQKISNVSLVLMPIQSAFVKGDVAKFRAINWTQSGDQSGIKALTLNAAPAKGIDVSFAGSGIFGDEDYVGSMLLTKDGVGYVKLDYDTFRKYYENKGGNFPFTSAGLNQKTLEKDLQMDIGHFAIEMGKGTVADPDFSLGYERDTKVGAKDSTTWGYIQDTGFSANTTYNRRKIAPIYLEKDETTDTLTAKGKAEISGFTLKGEQKYVFLDASRLRNEQIYHNTAAPGSTNKIIQQTETPQTKELSTAMRADRWTLNDKTYMSFGYRYGQLRNSMNLVERDYNPVTGALLTGGNFTNGYALNQLDTHTLTGQLLSNLTEKLVLISRFKAELRNKHSDSVWDDLTDALALSSTASQRSENRINSTAESFSLRYAGLPKTSLYADLELRQERQWEAQEYYDADPTDNTNHESINHVPQGAATIGMRINPINKVTLTTELKHSDKTDKKSQVTGTSAHYINKIETISDSISTRLSWKPLKWFEHSVKVKASQGVYRQQSFSLDSTRFPVEEQDFIYDMTLMPTDAWLFNAAFARKQSKIGESGSATIVAPAAFTGNVSSWTLSSSYSPTEKVSIFSALEYARAKNDSNEGSGNDLAVATGPMQFGVDAAWYNLDTGLSLNLKKDLTIEPHYGYSSYRSFGGVDTGNYSAHIVWLDVTTKW